MNWQFHDVSAQLQAVIAVSKQGHCLNSILHRWSSWNAASSRVVTVVVQSSGPAQPHRMARPALSLLPIIGGDKAGQEKRIADLYDGAVRRGAAGARPLYADSHAGELRQLRRPAPSTSTISSCPASRAQRLTIRRMKRGVKLIGATAHYVTTDLGRRADRRTGRGARRPHPHRRRADRYRQ